MLEPSKPIASLTLNGYTPYTRADLSNRHLTVSFGNDPAIGSSYLYIKGTAY